MKPIDLLTYAQHSTKIPSITLNHASPMNNPASLFRLLLAHAVDFYIVANFTILSCTLFQISFKELLVSHQLSQSGMASTGVAGLIFCITLISYFFFSNFMNHGQSLGMLFVKSRITMKEKCLRSSLQWGLVSSLVIMTGGLLTYLPVIREMLVNHDYLYLNLMDQNFELKIDQPHLLALSDRSSIEVRNKIAA